MTEKEKELSRKPEGKGENFSMMCGVTRETDCMWNVRYAF